jgi:hypothetical protein
VVGKLEGGGILEGPEQETNEGKIDGPGLGVYVAVLPDGYVEMLLDADAGVMLDVHIAVQKLPLRYDAGPFVLPMA